MTTKSPFYQRLRGYYEDVSSVLRGEAKAASIFPNSTDVGMTREKVYEEFLRQHLPSSCNIFAGGFLFNRHGEESRQLDLIVTADVCPQYNFNNPNGNGKSFACVDGTLAVASIKSKLDSTQLIEALDNISSIPAKQPIDGKVVPSFRPFDYYDWPVKIIYASDGISAETILETLNDYCNAHKLEPGKAPSLIHVAGKYFVQRTMSLGARTRTGTLIPPNQFYASAVDPDIHALNFAIQLIQERCAEARNIMFTYEYLLDPATWD